MVKEVCLLKYERNCYLWSVKRKSILHTFVGIESAPDESSRGEYCTIQKTAQLKTSQAIPLPVNIISMPCSDQPSYSQEQSIKRVALEDLRCVHIKENINSSLSTIGAALKIRAVPGWKTCKGILSFKEYFCAIKPRNLKTIRRSSMHFWNHRFGHRRSPMNFCKIIPKQGY